AQKNACIPCPAKDTGALSPRARRCARVRACEGIPAPVRALSCRKIPRLSGPRKIPGPPPPIPFFPSFQA
ncbi:hypothetical protein MCGFDL_MCGFDL_01210, partial [Dysosmobacter welbionis]